MQLNLEPRIRRLEQQTRLLCRNDDDNRLRLRLIAADQRMARYRATKPPADQIGKKAA